MKHTWVQKRQTNFLNYGSSKVTEGKSMTREEQLARFHTIYDRMSLSDQECIKVGMAYVFGFRVGMIFIIGILIGHFIW